MKKALEINPEDPQLIFDYNHLLQLTNSPVNERVELLENNMDLVRRRDDLYLELIRAYNQKGDCKKRLSYLLRILLHLARVANMLSSNNICLLITSLPVKLCVKEISLKHKIFPCRSDIPEKSWCWCLEYCIYTALYTWRSTKF